MSNLTIFSIDAGIARQVDAVGVNPGDESTELLRSLSLGMSSLPRSCKL